MARSLHQGERPSLLLCPHMPIDRNEIHWFPMRVANHRELRVRDELKRLNIEHYLPLKWGQRLWGGHMRRVQVPALNIIFVHSSKEEITKQKMFNAELAYLRYKMNSCHDSDTQAEVMVVPDREMNNFMFVTQRAGDNVNYLTYTDFLDKESRRVRIVDGDFMGAEGVIKRIKKDRCVVVTIKGLAAVALQIPFENLEFI